LLGRYSTLIKIYIPCVVKGRFSSALYDVRHVCNPGLLVTNRVRSRVKIDNMNRSRNACVTDFVNSKDRSDFVAMQDNDCVHVNPDCLYLTRDFMRSNPQHGAVALPWKREHFDFNHVRCLCVLFRSEVFRSITFRATTTQCTCIGLKQDIEAMGYIYSYLPIRGPLVSEEL
jgi:hypothetical protein